MTLYNQLSTNLHQKKLLLVWAKVPFPPFERLQHNRYQIITHLQAAMLNLAPISQLLSDCPPLPILSLDPTERIEVSLDAAGVPHRVVRARGDVPARDMHNLLKLGGHLADRSGLFLTWEDVENASNDQDKVHLLQEAYRVTRGGAMLMFAPEPDETLTRFWHDLLLPAVREAVIHAVIGPESFDWPDPLVWLNESLESALPELKEASVAKLPPQEIDVPLDPEEFDVFLAHNSTDKESVRAIAGELKQRGLNPWLDEQQIPPGRWFQDVIQEAIPKVQSAAIFIGVKGLGKWQLVELRSFISQCLDRDMPVIPVLLPGIEELPTELLFLQELNWVKFQSNIDEVEPLDRLEWGITGRKPRRLSG